MNVRATSVLNTLPKDLIEIVYCYIHHDVYSIVMKDLVNKCQNIAWRLDENQMFIVMKMIQDTYWRCTVCGHWRWISTWLMNLTGADKSRIICGNPEHLCSVRM